MAGVTTSSCIDDDNDDDEFHAWARKLEPKRCEICGICSAPLNFQPAMRKRGMNFAGDNASRNMRNMENIQ